MLGPCESSSATQPFGAGKGRGVSGARKRARPVRLPHPERRSFVPPDDVAENPVVAGPDSGGGTVAAVDVADARSSAGRSPARESTEASAAGSRDDTTTATLAFFHDFLRNLCAQPPGPRHPTARHSGFCDDFCCRFGTPLDARAG